VVRSACKMLYILSSRIFTPYIATSVANTKFVNFKNINVWCITPYDKSN